MAMLKFIEHQNHATRLIKEDNMLTKVEQEIKASMFAKQAKRLGVLRMVKAELINNAKTAKPKDEMSVVSSYLKKLQGTRELNATHNIDSTEINEEIKYVEELLPPAISEETLEIAVKDLMKTETNIGVLMKALKLQFPTADGRVLNQLISKNKQ